MVGSDDKLNLIGIAIAEFVLAGQFILFFFRLKRSVPRSIWYGIGLLGSLSAIGYLEYGLRQTLRVIAFDYPAAELWLDTARAIALPVNWLSVIIALFVMPQIEWMAKNYNAMIQQLEHDSVTDALTGLPNSRILERLNPDEYKAALYLDLNNFKQINDWFGHQVGDALIRAIAQRLIKLLAGKGLLVRLHGDEFVAFLYQTEDATALARLIAVALREPFQIGMVLNTSASIGVSLNHPLSELLTYAEAAMRECKAAVDVDFVVFDQAREARFKQNVRLEHDLRAAIGNGEIYVEYQPIVVLKTGKITGFEALARWRHPQLGNIPPNYFVAIAERSGLIFDLFELVFRISCEQARFWQRYNVSVAVNVSRLQIARADFANTVSGLLRTTQAPTMHLEITETAIADTDAMLATLNTLHQMHLVLAIDDFGAGQSSLANLAKLPVQSLKLDQQFVRSLSGSDEFSHRQREICRCVIGLARSCKLEIIAEGVEEQAQSQILQALGCRLGQGWLFSRAISATDATRLLRCDRGIEP